MIQRRDLLLGGVGLLLICYRENVASALPLALPARAARRVLRAVSELGGKVDGGWKFGNG
jgi:hypothetical protein